MKKSYLKIIILNFVLLATVIICKFITNNLSNYLLLIMIGISCLILCIMLGMEKRNFRYSKDVIMLIVIYLITILLATYIIGVVIGFVRSPDYHNWFGLKTFIIPSILLIIVTELFRETLLRKLELCMPLIIATTIMFIFLDVVLKISASTFISSYNTLLFVAYYLIPSIIKNVLCSYLCYKVGFKASIVYRMIIECYTFIIPIYPDLGDYIGSMFRILTPTVVLLCLHKKIKDEIVKDIEIHVSGKLFFIRNGLAVLSIALCIYLTSGIFKYYSLAIGSGSMSPNIYKGDMVIVEKLSGDEKQNVSVGDILVYRKDSKVVVHRIVEIYNDDKDFIVYTKGDANPKIDNYPIDSSMFIGLVKFKIPVIGYPSIYINAKMG